MKQMECSLTDEKKKAYIRRILLARLRLLSNHGFYGSLLMHLKFGITPEVDTAYTNGYKICFNPKFLDELTDKELDFILMHELLHIVLKHCFRGKQYNNNNLFNIACDIVVNSTILKSCNMVDDFITLKKYGKSIHLTPNGAEGYNFTAEEVYKMLLKTPLAKSKDIDEIKKAFDKLKGEDGDAQKGDGKPNNESTPSTIDDHSMWDEELVGDNKGYVDEWDERLMNAIEAELEREKTRGVGDVPLGALRRYRELRESKVNWRVLLNNFLQTEITDYSFTPPDRRYDGDFFLPDFNEEEEKFKEINVFVAIDTSASISDDDITKAFSELKGAFKATDNKIKGWLAFFDARLYELNSFDSIDDVLKLKVYGGGGTSFHAIFDGLKEFKEIVGDKPDMIIIFTDGYADFPKESVRENIPTLWLINNLEVTPPWGVIARMKD